MSESQVNMFEQASRKKLRFETPKGYLPVEDLWDLPLTSTSGKANLDTIAQALYKELQEQPQVSFVDRPAADATRASLELQFNIVKHIIDTRLAEREAKAQAKDIRERRQAIMAAIDSKKKQELEGADVSTLEKMLAELPEPVEA